MGVNFGTISKASFNISSSNVKAQNLLAKYNDKFNIFTEAKKAERNAQGNSGDSEQTVNTADLTKARENAQKELLALQETLEKEVKNEKNSQKPDVAKPEAGNSFNSMG